MRLRRLAAIVVLLAGLGWLFVNGPVEGRTLLLLTPSHGFTAADLLSVYAVLGAAWLWITT